MSDSAPPTTRDHPWQKKNTGEIYRQALVQEIAAENNLITNRMTWNLTFQGFLFTGYALALGKDCPPPPSPPSLPDPASTALTCALTPHFMEVLPYAGMAASAFALLGVVAALWQIVTLQRRWTAELEPWGPQPFSSAPRAVLGAIPPLALPIIVFLAWYCLSR